MLARQHYKFVNRGRVAGMYAAIRDKDIEDLTKWFASNILVPNPILSGEIPVEELPISFYDLSRPSLNIFEFMALLDRAEVSLEDVIAASKFSQIAANNQLLDRVRTNYSMSINKQVKGLASLELYEQSIDANPTGENMTSDTLEMIHKYFTNMQTLRSIF